MRSKFLRIIADQVFKKKQAVVCLTVCLGWTKLMFFYFHFLCKSMGESFLLSEDEPLTLNIDGVMAL